MGVFEMERESSAAKTIREIMKSEDVSQTDLARLAGCNRQAVQQSLSRRSGDMRVSTFVKLIMAMGYSLQAVKISQ